MACLFREIGHYQQYVVPFIAKKREIRVWIETRQTKIYIHEIEKSTFTQSLTLVAESEHALVDIAKPALVRGKQGVIACSVVIPTANSRHAPVVEDGCPVVFAGETFIVARRLSQFLTVVHQERSPRDHGRHHKWRHHPQGISGIGSRSESYLVMILQKVHHAVADAVYCLPASGELGRRPSLCCLL